MAVTGRISASWDSAESMRDYKGTAAGVAVLQLPVPQVRGVPSSPVLPGLSEPEQ